MCAKAGLGMTTYDGTTTPQIVITSPTVGDIPQIQNGDTWTLPASTEPITFRITSSELVRLDQLTIFINGFINTIEVHYLDIDEASMAGVSDLYEVLDSK